MATKIGERAYLIDTKPLGNAGTVAVYVVRGSKTAVIDCGYASSNGNVLEGLKEIGVQPSEVDYLIPTHVHLDHAGGAGLLLKHMPKAKVIAQERATPHLVDPTRLVQSATSVYGEELIRAYGIPAPIDKERIQSVSEEVHIDLGGISLTAVHSPGHAPHQISVFVEEDRLLLSADAVGMIYPGIPTMIPATPPPSLDPEKLSDSVDRLIQMAPAKLLVPHYGVREDVSEVFERTKSKTAEWLSKVKTMKAEGLTQLGIASRLAEEVRTEAGIASLPFYGSLSIKVSTMGLVSFLERQ